MDFFCEEAKLIVEVDGGQHAEQAGEDEKRTQMLSNAGYLVIRFWNNEVLRTIEGILQRIVKAAQREQT